MNKWFGRPVRFIEVERIFFYLLVKRDQTFIVASFYATFVANIGSKIKHVPHICGPKERSGGEYFPYFFMEQSMILFGIILNDGISRVVFHNSLRSIFGNR